jgi:hypothetical protein
MMPTREREHDIAKKKNYIIPGKSRNWNEKYKAKYEGNVCVTCLMKDQIHLENRSHIFLTCKTSSRQSLLNEMTKKMLSTISLITKKEVTSFPWWFTEGTDNTAVTDCPYVKELQNFDKLYGIMGIMPNALLKYLLTLQVKHSVAMETIKRFEEMIVNTSHQIWKERCDHLEKWTNEKLNRPLPIQDHCIEKNNNTPDTPTQEEDEISLIDNRPFTRRSTNTNKSKGDKRKPEEPAKPVEPEEPVEVPVAPKHRKKVQNSSNIQITNIPQYIQQHPLYNHNFNNNNNTNKRQNENTVDRQQKRRHINQDHHQHHNLDHQHHEPIT